MPYERYLLMGPPGSGKSFQLLNIARYLNDKRVPFHIIDCEDKLSAMVDHSGGFPENTQCHVAIFWEEMKLARDEIEKTIKPNSWIGVDRIDLAWPAVQRWFTQKKYHEELAERMLQTSIDMKKKAMFTPRFDQGAWQVINEEYESFMLSILYRMRSNVVLTAGIRGVDENSPYDIFGHLGVAPRGQKELGHQPHSAFLLFQKRQGNTLAWHITTAKDLPGREVFESEPLIDFPIQYITNYNK